MSKRKDRDRVLRRQRLDPGYKGFRGFDARPPSKPSLRALICTVCGRKKYAEEDVPEEAFVCKSCLEERAQREAG